MRIDPSQPAPIFKQIADYIRGGIAAGVYRADEALPSKRALALKLGVNPLTVQHAYAELEKDGLVFARKGVGMFVAKRGVGQAQVISEKACYELLLQAFLLARKSDLSAKRVEHLISKALDEVGKSKYDTTV